MCTGRVFIKAAVRKKEVGKIETVGLLEGFTSGQKHVGLEKRDY
jgi:hypothetical protein